MTNKSKYDQVFTETFSLDAAKLGSGLAYSQVEGWDSIGHMQLVAALEEAFDITMDTDDIIGFSSYDKGFEILGKYQIQFDNA
jgi:acyl carrier protein